MATIYLKQIPDNTIEGVCDDCYGGKINNFNICKIMPCLSGQCHYHLCSENDYDIKIQDEEIIYKTGE